MNLQCDHCTRTTSGTETDLLDAGWARITISSPIHKTFTACPDHGVEMAQAAFEAIKATSPRHVEMMP